MRIEMEMPVLPDGLGSVTSVKATARTKKGEQSLQY